jgi:uncharacterized protein YeaO (DUF488 family)
MASGSSLIASGLGTLKRSGHGLTWWWDLVPTPALYQWFHRDLRKWEEFRRRYRLELEARGRAEELRRLAERAKGGRITLLFGARGAEHNAAVVLKELLEELS